MASSASAKRELMIAASKLASIARLLALAAHLFFGLQMVTATLPSQNARMRVGIWVLLFLLILTFAAWRLNAAFWKNVK